MKHFPYARSAQLLLAAAISLNGCADHKRREPVRHVKDAAAAQENPNAQDVKAALTPLKSVVEHEPAPKACERLEQLGAESRDGKDTFSYLGFAGTNGETPVGNIELKESEFVQLILGETFKVDDFDTFFAKAEKEYEAGRLSAVKWLLLKSMKAMGLGQRAQFSATNDKLAEKFPGIFGESGPLTGALHWGLAQRAAGLPLRMNPEIAKILSTKLALFPGDGSWEAHADATRLSVGAAVRGLRENAAGTPESAKERLCATVLLHQNFSQLLRIKGHKSPVILASETPNGPSRVEKLSATNLEFKKEEKPGAIFDLMQGKQVLLESEAIKTYMPSATSLMTIIDSVPGPAAKGELGSLKNSLSFLEAMLLGFEGSSPAADGTTEANYVYGDISAENSTAVLPVEMNTLSLGLLTMQLKNVAGLHIEEVNFKGIRRAKTEAAGGVVIKSQPTPAGDPKSVTVKLDEVIRLARVVVFLESALLRLETKPAASLAKLNQAYSAETLATLKGLREKLVVLKFPLVLLLSKMGTAREGCAAELEWDLETGVRKPVAACDKPLKLKLADVFELMARDAKSPLLLQKARELRR